MAKTFVSGTELLVRLNKAISRYDVCTDVRITNVVRVTDPASQSNWDVHYARGSGTSVPPDCIRAIIAAKLELQRDFDLLSED